MENHLPGFLPFALGLVRVFLGLGLGEGPFFAGFGFSLFSDSAGFLSGFSKVLAGLQGIQVCKYGIVSPKPPELGLFHHKQSTPGV